MKLEQIAEEAISLIKKSGNKGILTSELATNLKISKRRVYDVKAIMKAAGMITTKRNAQGTRLFWALGDESGASRISKLHAKRIKITTSGMIVSVSQKATEVIIECSKDDIKIESLDENL